MIAEVIVDVMSSEVDRVFDYEIPSSLADITKGYRVSVPFGNRKIEGYIVNIKKNTDCPKDKLKCIINKLDEFPIIKPELIDLMYFMKNNLYLRLLDGIRLAVPTQVRKNIKDKIERIIYLDDTKISEFMSSLTKRNKKSPLVIGYLQEKGKENYTKLSKLFSSDVINKMLKVGVLIEEKIKINRLNLAQGQNKTVELTDIQKNAVNKILKSKDKPIVLFGVTGSGKTEVYMNVIENIINNGKNALMLLPEISLTPQMVRIFTARFGKSVAVLHSALSEGEKRDEWFRVYNGEAKIVVGARSAVFAPLSNIGVIIIDEEHDGSYLSDSNPRYLTHTIAKFRSEYNKGVLVLGSATPSVETFYKAKNNEYNLVEMPIRVNKKPLPPVEIVDMSKEFKLGNNTGLSTTLMENLENVINNNKQAILFINRRGFSSYLMCRECSYIPKCTDCDANLVYHKNDGVLKCHFCGKKFKALTNCPVCSSSSIKLGATGTQQVVEQIKEKFPNLNVFRLDNDSVTTKDSYTKILNDFSATKPSVLVGTQMVTKGHDFPAVTFVGIIDADISLFNYSYKANETTYQLITQVSGRSGRSDDDGNVVLQTYVPNNPVYLNCANYDYLKFYDKEINLRETRKFPPFARLVRILLTSENDVIVKNTTHEIMLKLKNYRVEYGKEFFFLQGMKAPVSKIKNKHRYQIVLRFSNICGDEIIDRVYKLLDEYKNSKISIFVENNPQSLS